MDTDITIPNKISKIPRYNLEVLQKLKLLSDESLKTKDSKELSSDQATKSNNDWRLEPYLDNKKDVMIICSYGDEFQDVDIAEKITDNSVLVDGKVVLARKELDVLQDLISTKPETHSLVCVCPDFPGAQLSKEYYLDRIKQFFVTCEKRNGGFLYYTGHGERITGNWCFKDGVITFEEIFGLYFDVMRGKPLYIVSDCSYAGKWVKDAVKKIDEIGIPSCGHHTRMQGILLKVIVSCQKHQIPIMNAYSDKLASINKETDKYLYIPTATIVQDRQECIFADFIGIRCNKKHDEQCQLDSTDYNWADRMLNGSLVYCVRGKDKGKPAWHYVLVDGEKENAFKEKVKTGSVDVADYGKVLHSGWGENPPQDMKNKITRKFGSSLPADD